MGFVPLILLVFFLIISMFLSFQSTHLLAVDASLIAAEYISGDRRENRIEKVSGDDEREEKEALVLEKFRFLLGLKNFDAKTPSNGEIEAPAPSPTIEAPAPLHPIQVHPHRPFHRPHSWLHKTQNEKGDHKGRFKRILISASASVAAMFVIFSIGLIWVCRKSRRERKRSTNPVSIQTYERGNRNGSVKKVSSDPGLDLFYLDSIEAALEPPHAFPLKQDPEIVNISLVPNQNTLSSKVDEREESEKETVRSESDDKSSDAGEIVSVHDSGESVNYDTVEFNITEIIANSSDDESFHSLSSASAGSLNDIADVLSLNGSNLSTPPPPPPPPPPPLPPLLPIPTSSLHISPSPPSSSSTSTMSKALNSPTLPFSSSPRNSDSSSSGSNQTPKREFPPPPPNPPPKPLVGIPPPPCPPSISKGFGNNSLKTPPPPQPSQQFHFMPLGKDGAPLPKLKPLHWDKVRAMPDRSMVWDKLSSSSFEFDEEMIESLFGYNIQNSMKNDEAKSKSPSPSKHVLDPKRLQNMTILSKALNVTAEQVCDVLLQGEGLCLQQLEALVKMVPTKEEVAKLSSYKGDIKELGSTENFLKAILNIPFAFLRIEAMLYRETFEDEVVHLRKSFSMLEEACKELRSSRLFLKLLEAVLKTGNRMNVGTIRGGARAFKLDALLKLADVKGTDGRTTLLHFVVQEIVRSEGIRVSESIMGKINQKNKVRNAEERERDYRRMGLDLVSGLTIELCNVKKTAMIDLDVLASSVSNLSDGMAKLQQLVGKDLFGDEKSGNFMHKMRFFLGYAEKNIKELREDEGRVLVRVKEITEYFHGNVSKDEANPLRIFVIVRDFLGMLDHVCKELRSSKVPSSPNPLAPFT